MPAQKYQRIIILCNLVVITLFAAALPATAETPSEKADALLSGLIQTNDPGVAVLVAQDGKILFERGYGLADLEHRVPITPQTTFRIASITKQFTASAILKLQEEGKLSVGDKLSKYIPDFPRGDEVTLRQLLNHTSGIHDYLDEPEFQGGAINPTTIEAIIETIKKYPYDFEPGTKWHYSNSGYVLLSYIVTKVSGQSIGDFLSENFFQLLGMTNTGVYSGQTRLPNEALGYNVSTNGFTCAPSFDPSWEAGDSGLYSTVKDLDRWNEGIFNGRILDAASLKVAFTTTEVWDTNKLVNVDACYGFGWEVSHYRGLRFIEHGGSIPGFLSCLLCVPDYKFTVAILGNVRPGWPNANPRILASQMADIFLTHKFRPLPTINTNVSPESYNALTGRYNLESGRRMLTISRRGPHLFGQWDDWPEVEIFPASQTNFFAKVVDAQITFVKDASGKTVKVMLHERGIDVEAARVNDTAGR